MCCIEHMGFHVVNWMLLICECTLFFFFLGYSAQVAGATRGLLSFYWEPLGRKSQQALVQLLCLPSPSPVLPAPQSAALGNSAHYSAEDLGSQASNAGLFSHSGPWRRSRQGTGLCVFADFPLWDQGLCWSRKDWEEASASGPSLGSQTGFRGGGWG